MKVRLKETFETLENLITSSNAAYSKIGKNAYLRMLETGATGGDRCIDSMQLISSGLRWKTGMLEPPFTWISQDGLSCEVAARLPSIQRRQDADRPVSLKL